MSDEKTVERVARALWHDHAMQYADVPLEDWARVEEPYRKGYLRDARVAIAAMPNDAERVPLTYLLGQYDRLLAAHEHVVMDTPEDQARHRQVAETFRAAAEPIRRSIPGLGEVLRVGD